MTLAANMLSLELSVLVDEDTQCDIHYLRLSTKRSQLSAAMQNVYIAFGGPDADFARKLDSNLRSHGIKTFVSGAG